jgi:hypothetical protein
MWVIAKATLPARYFNNFAIPSTFGNDRLGIIGTTDIN